MLTTYKPSKDNRQLFNDGTLTGIETAGPLIMADLTRAMPFGAKVIGASRFYHAMGEKVKLSRLVVVPYDQSMNGVSKVLLNDFRSGITGVFKVIQLQELPDSAPPAMQLSLELLETEFEDRRPVHAR